MNNGTEVATILRTVQSSNRGTGKTFFLFSKTIRQTLEHIHSPLQLVLQVCFPPAVIRTGYDVDYSPPFYFIYLITIIIIITFFAVALRPNTGHGLLILNP